MVGIQGTYSNYLRDSPPGEITNITELPSFLKDPATWVIEDFRPKTPEIDKNAMYGLLPALESTGFEKSTSFVGIVDVPNSSNKVMVFAQQRSSPTDLPLIVAGIFDAMSDLLAGALYDSGANLLQVARFDGGGSVATACESNFPSSGPMRILVRGDRHYALVPWLSSENYVNNYAMFKVTPWSTEQ